MAEIWQNDKAKRVKARFMLGCGTDKMEGEPGQRAIYERSSTNVCLTILTLEPESPPETSELAEELITFLRNNIERNN